MKFKKFITIILFTVSFYCFAQEESQLKETYRELIVTNPDLAILQKDIVVREQLGVYGDRIGVDLYVRKKPKIQSVMLVETTKDPAGKEANYAYRASQWNKINGDEIRYLDGKELHSQYSMYSLISSTVTTHPELGECFHIYIPMILEYGYPWSRNGKVEIGKGTFVNIRTFSKKYGDYTGEFQDNPFMFDFEKTRAPAKKTEPKQEIPEPKKEAPKPAEPPVILTDDYNSLAAQKFKEIASGDIIYSKGPKTIVNDLYESIEKINPKDKVDVVFAIDTTGSMKDDMDTLKNEWIPVLINQLSSFGDVRLGLLFYRDYNDSYSFKGLPVKFFDFTRYVEQFKRCLDSAVIRGNEGGDVPEAVYEAIFACTQYYDWRKDATKKIILIGDAQPHDKPRGSRKITQEYVTSLAKEKNILLDCIIVPDDKSSRSRK